MAKEDEMSDDTHGGMHAVLDEEAFGNMQTTGAAIRDGKLQQRHAMIYLWMHDINKMGVQPNKQTIDQLGIDLAEVLDVLQKEK